MLINTIYTQRSSAPYFFFLSASASAFSLVRFSLIPLYFLSDLANLKVMKALCSGCSTALGADSTDGCTTGKTVATSACLWLAASAALVFLSKTTNLDLYSCNLVTLASKVSSLLFCLLWSTEIPMVLAYLALNPTAFNSAKVNPLPALTFLLYLIVGHLTTGLKVSIGLGAILAALVNLWSLLEAFLPAWSKWTLTRSCQCFLK